MAKGFYIRKGKKDTSIYLHIYKPDFIAFLNDLHDNKGWVKLRIYERDSEDTRGFTHNMEVIQNSHKIAESESKPVND